MSQPSPAAIVAAAVSTRSPSLNWDAQFADLRNIVSGIQDSLSFLDSNRNNPVLQRCGNCNQLGHHFHACPEIECFGCKCRGHIQRHCPDSQPRSYRSHGPFRPPQHRISEYPYTSPRGDTRDGSRRSSHRPPQITYRSTGSKN